MKALNGLRLSSSVGCDRGSPNGWLPRSCLSPIDCVPACPMCFIAVRCTHLHTWSQWTLHNDKIRNFIRTRISRNVSEVSTLPTTPITLNHILILFLHFSVHASFHFPRKAKGGHLCPIRRIDLVLNSLDPLGSPWTCFVNPIQEGNCCDGLWCCFCLLINHITWFIDKRPQYRSCSSSINGCLISRHWSCLESCIMFNPNKR
jgi:hypothetical protein